MYVIDAKKKVMKFIRTLPNHQQIIEKLKQLQFFKSNERLNLDIERIKNDVHVYRLRIGEIRIIFHVIKEKGIIYIKSADYRGKVYK